jgi:thymidylate synthase (FAD)
MKIVPQSVELIAHTVGVREEIRLPNPLIEYIARTCYKSESKITADSAVKLIEQLCNSGHLAMIEHLSVTIRMIIDRGISHELVRHRIGAYAQESTRWIKYKDGITVIEPPGLTNYQRDVWMRLCEDAETTYRLLIDAGCKAQIARSVLPTCLKTEVVTTFNLRQWLHVLALRMAKDCHPQMREVMRMCHDCLIGEVPTLFNIPALFAIRDAKKE